VILSLVWICVLLKTFDNVSSQALPRSSEFFWQVSTVRSMLQIDVIFEP
jgi:hypothetical protein